MQIVLYHVNPCKHGHNMNRFGVQLYRELTENQFNVLPARAPTKNLTRCQSLVIAGVVKPANILKEYLYYQRDYLVIIADPDGTGVVLEWSESGDQLNNAELFNDYLTRRGESELPVVTTQKNLVAEYLGKTNKPYSILRVGDGTPVSDVVSVVEKYREYLE